jgi:pre-rRNA-processing protein TSR1
VHNVDPDRIILKKVILSGYPLRVKKSWAVIRYMFFSPEDVRWFKPVDLWTKYGMSGRIVEPVGTHGLFKCTFNKPIKNNDTVCMSLYKRVFPKPVNEFADLQKEMEQDAQML